MKKILFIVGSTRSKSFNLQVARYVEKLLVGKVEVTWLDYSDVPFVNQDFEFPAPAAVSRVRSEVGKADALWIFTPEYNHSYPGVLKNLLDWLSRPVKPGDTAIPTAIRGKKVAVTGIGGGGMTQFCRKNLKDLLEFIGAELPVDSLGLRADLQSWETGVITLDEEQKKQLAGQAEAFLSRI